MANLCKFSPRVWIAVAVSAGVLMLAVCCCGGVFFFWFPRAADNPLAPPMPFAKNELVKNDLEATKQWAYAASRKFDSLRGNDLALADAARKFNDEQKKLLGSKVQWKVTVDYIRGETVGIVSVWTYKNHLQQDAAYFFLLRDVPENNSWPLQEIFLEVGQEITRDRAVQLRPGSTITLKGTIQLIDFNGKTVRVKLGDMRGE